MRGWKQYRFRFTWFPIGILGFQFFWLLTGAYGQAAQPAASVLREGLWVKIGVTGSGVYRLDQATLARLNPAFTQADPRRLRLYGNGGAPLPQANAIVRPADLIENAIQVTGEADGRFDATDALLFFGQSPHAVRYDSTNRRFVHQTNPYTDTTFYFLTIGAAPGRRIPDRPAGSLGAKPDVTMFEDFWVHERDLSKLSTVRSGREWLGEYMTNGADTTLTIPVDLPGQVANAPVRLTASVVAGATVRTAFGVACNGQSVGTIPMPTISGYEYDYQGIARTDTFRITNGTPANPFRLTLTFRKNGQNSAQGYVNYLTAQVRRELRQYDQPTWARRLPAGQYAVGGATTGLRVWDVTDPLAPVQQAYTLSSGQEAGWAGTVQADYFLFTDGQRLTPASLAIVANQNLRGQPVPNLLIVTPATWRTEAERLAEFRRQHDQLTVLVATTEEVFNEFGSGQPDPTAIRDAARYFYNRQPNGLRYLLLFGDATYDYRNRTGLLSPAQQANTVPVYESRESLHPVLSYSSDDYFGFLDASEGEWVESAAGDHLLDIGVGRLPVKSVEEARTVVDKLIRYSSDPTLTGDWQTRVMLVADDGDFNVHQLDANQLATDVETQAPAYRPERVFLDAYPQENTSTGQKSFAVSQLIDRAITDGRLIINYSGHGGVLTLADEQIVTLQNILSWKNRRLPLFVTATCQFGRYDDPGANSGAELALLSRLGGVIGLLTTTRPVYQNTNFLLNTAFYKAVFKPLNGQMPRLGDVLRQTKNQSLSGPLNRNFTLLGDPSMRLAYPQAEAVLTTINNRPTEPNRLDTLRALQPVALSGEIRRGGTLEDSFSGTVRITLYDKATVQTTLGAEVGSPKMAYRMYSSPVFTGQVPVTRGRFSLRFTVPKDISYAFGLGKLYAYAVRTDSLMDALGSAENLIVGGSIVPDSVDSQPPVVRLSVDGSQSDGSEGVRVAGPDVHLRVHLRDNLGINVARSGLGHDLTAQLTGQSPVALNDQYTATSPDGRQGEAVWTFRGLIPGTYTVRVKAWDINNNSAEGSLTLKVSEPPGLSLRTVQVVPNPVTTQAVLTAEHNRPGEPLDWTVTIYDPTGRIVSQQAGQCADCPVQLDIGTWDGRTSDGATVPNGLYVFRLRVQSAADGSSTEQTGRLALIK